MINWTDPKEVKEYRKKFHEKNKEKRNEYSKQWRKNHPDYSKSEVNKNALKIYRQNNKEKIQEQCKEYYKKNKETIRKQNKQWYRENTSKHRDSGKKWVKNNPDKVKEINKRRNKKLSRYRREWDLKKSYNLTLEDYEKLVELCNNQCEICNKNLIKPCIDHDHQSKQIRGILCNNCNTGLGLLGDTRDSVIKALQYFDKQS